MEIDIVDTMIIEKLENNETTLYGLSKLTGLSWGSLKTRVYKLQSMGLLETEVIKKFTNKKILVKCIV